MVASGAAQSIGRNGYGPDEVAERATRPTAVALLVVALPAAVYLLPGPVFHWQQPLLLGLEAALAFVAWQIGRRHPTGAAVFLVAGQAGLTVAAEAVLKGSGVLFVCLALACSTLLPWSVAPMMCGIAAPCLLWALGRADQPPPFASLQAVVLPLLGTVLFFTSRASRSTLAWSWRRHADALRLSEALRDRQGQLNRTIKALDLAYRLLQRTNHELAEARAEADEARQLKERFTANISHELRTPLNLILGFSEMMYVSPQVYGGVNWTKPLRQDVARIYEASRHLSQLVDDVLDLSRVQADRLVLSREPCNLNEIAAAAVETIGGMMRAHAVRLRLDMDPSLPSLLLDGTRIRQVLYNMLSNAARFTENGEIVLTTEQHAGEVIASVRDTGVGISEHELGSIFDEFYQAEAASRKGGSGLGLAISKRIVQMHGGRIWAKSSLGEGTTVAFALPVDGGVTRVSRLTVSHPSPTPRASGPEYLLLLNDQPDVAELLGRHLGGYEVLCAGNVEQAREMSRTLHPRAVVLNLPPDEVLRLHSATLRGGSVEQAPTLFCSIPSVAWRAEAMGAYASLRKPVSKADLVALLKRVGDVHDVMVIDDDQGFVQLLERCLHGTPERFRVRSAFDGVTGLEAMRGRVPDVLLLDLLMPGMSGEQVLQAMRGDDRLAAVPAIILTAADVEDDLPDGQGAAVGLLQNGGWGLEHTLRALDGLLAHTEPRRVMADAEPPALPEALPG